MTWLLHGTLNRLRITSPSTPCAIARAERLRYAPYGGYCNMRASRVLRGIKTITLAISVLYISMLSSPGLAGEIECGFQQLSDRIYVIVGSNHKTCPKKDVEHPLTNPAIIVGDSGVIVVDPGSSLQVGRLILERIKPITDKPIVAIFNTHIHGLYWLGNQAIKERFPEARIYAHREMIKRIENGEGSFWVSALTGKYTGEKTKYVLPDVSLNGNEIEKIAGINIKVHHTGHAHTDHDILIEVPGERVLFLGGIVVEPEVPSQGVPQDANFKGQIAATEYAIAVDVDKFVPGRGDPGGVELPKRSLRFLRALYEGVQTYLENDLADFEISDRLKTDLAEYKQWYDFTYIGGVVSQMYLQIEHENF